MLFRSVDNLIFSHSDADILKNVYQTSVQRMQEGGFNLRSWNTNDPQLKELMVAEGRSEVHGCSSERVLGYLYDVESDTISLADFDVAPQVTTKRDLLSQISKVFDPLSLFLPVTIRGRLLMRATWQSKIGWDEIGRAHV